MTSAEDLEARIEDLQAQFAALLDEYLVARGRLRTLEAATGGRPLDDSATDRRGTTRTTRRAPEPNAGAWPEQKRTPRDGRNRRDGRDGVDPATQADVEAAIERAESEDEADTDADADAETDSDADIEVGGDGDRRADDVIVG